MSTYELQSDMLLVSFKSFLCHAAILRSDDSRLKFVRYRDIEAQEIRRNSIIVFVSHRWLHRNKPDSINNDKYKLICEGIKKIQANIGDAEVEYYIWIDYSCIDQNDLTRLSKDIQSLPAYIERSDFLLTPIPPNHISCFTVDNYLESANNNFSDDLNIISQFGDSMLEKDNNELQKYNHAKEVFSRTWIRLEQLIGSNAPLHPSGYNYFKRLGLHRNDRPHIFLTPKFGSRLIVLPPLTKKMLHILNPIHGKLTDEGDKPIIKHIMDGLDLDKTTEEYYVGSRNHYDQMEGTGTYFYSNGAKYIGDFLRNKIHGRGILYYPTGDRYEGKFVDGQKSGFGVRFYTNGGRYEGSYKNDIRHGKGVYYPPPALNQPPKELEYNGWTDDVKFE